MKVQTDHDENKTGDSIEMNEEDQDKPRNDSMEEQGNEERKMTSIPKRDYSKYKNTKNRIILTPVIGVLFEIEDKYDILDMRDLTKWNFSLTMILMLVGGGRSAVAKARDTDNTLFAMKQIDSPFWNRFLTFRIINDLKIRRLLKHENVSRNNWPLSLTRLFSFIHTVFRHQDHPSSTLVRTIR